MNITAVGNSMPHPLGKFAPLFMPTFIHSTVVSPKGSPWMGQGKSQIVFCRLSESSWREQPASHRYKEAIEKLSKIFGDEVGYIKWEHSLQT